MATSDENIYDEIEIEDMTYDAKLQIYHYPCPCGDRFEISLDDLRDGETDIGICPSCSLQIRVIYEVKDLPLPTFEEEQKKAKGDGTVMSDQQVASLAAVS
ncbi:Diphthamide biosynthesis protein 3 [Elasticomyces elasticus]|nr:Diphthamide biosynthesis protein 3 [Elasticomyces elasticus]